MKFLCVACDEPMTLKEVRGPEKGSMTVIFDCPDCGREIAMLTNAMETQMVRSLGVKIGGQQAAAEPMEMVRTSLGEQRDEIFHARASEPRPEPTPVENATSGCPFTHMVSEAHALNTEHQPHWTSAAELRIERIPSFARPMVKKSIEDYAREKGYTEINDAVMDEVRGRYGM